MAICAAYLSACATSPPTQEMSDARQSVEAAESVGAQTHAPEELSSAQDLLTKAQNDMQEGDYKRAQKEALAAKEAAQDAVVITQHKQQIQNHVEAKPEPTPELVADPIPEPVIAPEPPPPPSTKQYLVTNNDNLWQIAARKDIYNNALMWPLIYKNNADQINAPDQIQPGQTLVIELQPTAADRELAIHHAQHRDRQSAAERDIRFLEQFGLQQ